MMKQIPEELRKPLTDQQKREIRALEDMPDSEIDTSDIPEITELPPGAVRGLFYRGSMIRLPEACAVTSPTWLPANACP